MFTPVKSLRFIAPNLQPCCRQKTDVTQNVIFNGKLSIKRRCISNSFQSNCLIFNMRVDKYKCRIRWSIEEIPKTSKSNPLIPNVQIPACITIFHTVESRDCFQVNIYITFLHLFQTRESCWVNFKQIEGSGSVVFSYMLRKNWNAMFQFSF